MIRLFFFGIILLVIMFPFIILFDKQTKKEVNKLNEKKNVNKKDDKYYWYNYPHYMVLPSGRKINLPEYLTYEQYKNMDENYLARFLLRLDFRLIEENNNNDIVL